jgi:hypothetical protein
MKTDVTPLMEWIRPEGNMGTLQSVLLSTYGLSMSDPPFFEQDFLPTLLGLGGVRDRGYTAPANVERKLGEFYCGMVCDAHALADGPRPSLRIDVMPIGNPLYHAKVVLIHREHSVRLIISSANLTHAGYRRQREAATVLDFHEKSDLPPSILTNFASEWLDRLAMAPTADFRRALGDAVTAVQRWNRPPPATMNLRTVWGGGAVPLWRSVVDAWPQSEQILEWQICSPFWPGPAESETPFDVLRRALDERGAKISAARMRLYTCADVPGERGRPCFPFELVEQLSQRGFRPTDATIIPVRLDALDTEVTEGKAEDLRPLHAKWIFLQGAQTALVLIGSANFTRRGLGVVRDPTDANIEVCLLTTGPVKSLSIEALLPPLAEKGMVQWADCRSECLAVPAQDIEVVAWPTFITRIDLAVAWETTPISGVLEIEHTGPEPFSIALESEHANDASICRVNVQSGLHSASLSDTQVSALLIARRVAVEWGEPVQRALFPINIKAESKTGLPAVLGQDPTEQDLLAYFHGRISEDDLMNTLLERARQLRTGIQVQCEPPGRELQNYVMREFLEGLYGMKDVLRSSASAPRVFEQALLGEFSPVRLGTEVQRAFFAGRRTCVATGFQLVELLQLIDSLEFRDNFRPVPEWFNETRERSLEQLLRVVSVASDRPEFRETCLSLSFRGLVNKLLSAKTAGLWWATFEQR